MLFEWLHVELACTLSGGLTSAFSFNLFEPVKGESPKTLLNRFQAALEQGIGSDDIVLIRDSEQELARILDSLELKSDGGEKQFASFQTLLRSIHGQLLMARYDLGGQMRHLDQGVAEFNRSLELVREFGLEMRLLCH